MKAPGPAAKASGGVGRLRTLRRVGTEAVLAINGDPRAIAKLVGRALRRVWRSPLARRLAAGAAVGSVLVLISVAGGVSGGSAAGVEGAAGPRFGADPMVWAAYTVAGRVWCAPDGAVRLSSVDLPEPWQQTDWRLVAAVGGVESRHAAGRSINGFGDVWPPVLGPLLDGTTPGLATIPDTDDGRFDFHTGWDRAAGPMQLLPATVASAGVDGNDDGIVDPHNLWDATATASAYLCVAGTGRAPSEAVFAYNRSDVYVDAVLGDLVEMVAAGVEEGHAGRLPDASPLPYVPSRSVGGPVLGSIVEHLGGDPDEVECGADCSWRVEPAPDAVPQWEPLRDLGYAAPVPVPGGLTAAGDGTLRGRVPTLGSVTWPVAVAEAPQPAGAAPPQWWGHWVPADAGEWTETRSRVVTIPAVWAAPVYAPQSGTATAAGGCVRLRTAAGWLWRLCGAQLDDGRSPNAAAGDRLGRAVGGSLAVQLVDPDGRRACPQRLFGLWAVGSPDTPEGLAAQIAAISEAAAGADDPDEAAGLAAMAAALEWALYEECVA